MGYHNCSDLIGILFYCISHSLNPVTDDLDMVNNQQELSVTEKPSLCPFDSSEAIADLAEMLIDLECAEGLEELQKVSVFTSDRLNRAARLLPVEVQQKLRQWAMENQISTAS